MFSNHVLRNLALGIAKVVVHNPIAIDNLSRQDLVNLREQTFNIINKELAILGDVFSGIIFLFVIISLLRHTIIMKKLSFPEFIISFLQPSL